MAVMDASQNRYAASAVSGSVSLDLLSVPSVARVYWKLIAVSEILSAGYASDSTNRFNGTGICEDYTRFAMSASSNRINSGRSV